MLLKSEEICTKRLLYHVQRFSRKELKLTDFTIGVSKFFQNGPQSLDRTIYRFNILD